MEWWERRKRLGEQMLATRRLYLDTRYWNDFCDCEIGQNTDADARDCLAAIRALVSSGVLTCIVEYHTFEELHQQKLPDKRLVSARLVDELSRRTMLVSPPERVFLEVLRSAQASILRRPIPPAPLDEMWTRPIFIAGHNMPALPSYDLPPEVVRALQAQFEEELWNTPFEALLEINKALPIGKKERGEAAEQLNRGKQDAHERFTSVRDLYLSEVDATLNAYRDQLAQVPLFLYKRAGGDHSVVPDDQTRLAAEGVRRILSAWAAKESIAHALPTVHIGAMLYAHVQWDLQRRYKANDLPDFGHAEAALPFCHAFATERSLATLLVQSKLSAEYTCAVLDDYLALGTWLDAEASVTRASA